MEIKTDLIEAHIFRKKGERIEFLLLKRANNEIYPGLWQMVTGSVEENEKAYLAALREIKEETGLTPSKFWIVPNVNSFYSDKKDAIYMIPVFAALADGESEIKLSHEHCEYKWVDQNVAADMLVWPGQIKSMNIICDYFINKKIYLNLMEIVL